MFAPIVVVAFVIVVVVVVVGRLFVLLLLVRGLFEKVSMRNASVAICRRTGASKYVLKTTVVVAEIV